MCVCVCVWVYDIHVIQFQQYAIVGSGESWHNEE